MHTDHTRNPGNHFDTHRDLSQSHMTRPDSRGLNIGMLKEEPTKHTRECTLVNDSVYFFQFTGSILKMSVSILVTDRRTEVLKENGSH